MLACYFVLVESEGQIARQSQPVQGLAHSGRGPRLEFHGCSSRPAACIRAQQCLSSGVAPAQVLPSPAGTGPGLRARLLSGTRFAAALDDGASITRRCGMDVHRLVAAEPCPSRTGSRVLSALTRCVQRPNRLVVAALFAQQRRSRSPRSHIWGRSSGVV